MNSGQNDEFNFASHVSELTNASWLLPDSDVHSTALHHSRKYPGAAWTSFSLTSTSPPASSACRDMAPDILPLPYLWTINLSPHPGPLLRAPLRPLHIPSYILWAGERAFCSSKAFATRVLSARREGNQGKPGLRRGGCTALQPLLSPAEIFSIWSMPQRISEAQDGTASSK